MEGLLSEYSSSVCHLLIFETLIVTPASITKLEYSCEK